MENNIRLFIVEADGRGGLAHYVYQLCTALADEGVDVTLVTAIDYELQDLPHNFKVVKLLRLWKHFDDDAGLRPDSWMDRARKLYTKLRRAVRAIRWVLAWTRLTIFLLRSKPDVIQLSKMHFALESFFIGFLRRRGFVLTQICHEFEEREGQSKLEKLLLGVKGGVYSNFSVIFFHAEENRNRFFSLYPSHLKENTHIIPHGNSSWLLNIKTQSQNIEHAIQKYGLSHEDRVILFFGLLAPSKGIDDLIEAFSIVRKACDVKLLIAGYPTKYIDMDALKANIDKLNLTGQVILDTRYIPVSEIGSLMSLATIVVYPYRSSTQSGALQVAYTFGKPVIATTVGGLPEAVEDGKCGFLVPAQNPSELASKITVIVNNPDLAKKMGDYSLHLSQTRFSWQSIARKIAQVYNDLIFT